MDTKLLKIFIAVANRKSVTSAAQDLGCAQSNVTSRIKQLEKTVGQTLFHRLPQGVSLNQEGEKLLTHAIDIVTRVEQAIAELQGHQKQEKLIIGSTESNAAVRITPFLLNLHNTFPDMEIELITGTTAEVKQLILDYKVNIAFFTGKNTYPELEVLNELEEQVVLVESKESVTNHTFISLKKGCHYQEMAMRYISELPSKNVKLLEFGSIETILGCVKAGMGKALLPISIVKKLSHEENFTITKLDGVFSNVPTTLVCHKNYPPKLTEYLKNIQL
jgi:DNA-binding transcriptional LysR family regulator